MNDTISFSRTLNLIKNRFIKIAAPILIIASTACSSFYPVRIQKFGAAAANARPADQVEVYHSEPSRPFIQIGRLTTESVNYDNPGHAVARLRAVAGEQGADAIIIERRGVRAAGASSVGSVDRDFGFGPPIGGPSQSVSGGYSNASYAEAIAIRWTGADPEEAFTKIHQANDKETSRPAKN